MRPQFLWAVLDRYGHPVSADRLKWSALTAALYKCISKDDEKVYPADEDFIETLLRDKYGMTCVKINVWWGV